MLPHVGGGARCLEATSCRSIGVMLEEVDAMSITIEAVYEAGVLKPAQPLPFQEHEKVRITVVPALSRMRRSAGLIGWTGSQEDADFVALSPELDPQDDECSTPKLASKLVLCITMRSSLLRCELTGYPILPAPLPILTAYPQSRDTDLRELAAYSVTRGNATPGRCSFCSTVKGALNCVRRVTSCNSGATELPKLKFTG
jgi:predicted DNA-binding antitoxin AbrB/MazE fold protein